MFGFKLAVDISTVVNGLIFEKCFSTVSGLIFDVFWGFGVYLKNITVQIKLIFWISSKIIFAIIVNNFHYSD